MELATQRAAAAAARVLQRRSDLTAEGRRTADEILGPLEAWLLCPCEEHLTAANAVAREQATVYGSCLATPDRVHLNPIRSALFSAGPLESSFGWQTTWGERSQTRLEHAGYAMWAAGTLSDFELRAALHEDLVPWLLGLGDPLKERVSGAGT